MDNIKHLSEVLKSQVALYSELADLMQAEKESVIAWAINDTVEITKKKVTLLRKERVQEEARNVLLAKIATANDKQSIILSEVIQLCTDSELANDLTNLGNRLFELVTRIHAENMALKMLYITNSRMINEFFACTGLSGSQGYGPVGSNKISTIQKIG